MSRTVAIGAAQMGPVQRDHTRKDVVERLVDLLHQAAASGCELVVYPELALTTFFPRWFVEDLTAVDEYYERSMPGPDTQPLFDEAARLGIGFCLGYAELTPDGHRYNTQVLVERDGRVVARYRKVHIPGHEHHEPDRPFQHAERHYFEPGPDEPGVWPAFGGRVGMMICNDRRWPETYRVMGLQGVELILCGYNTPIHYAPDPSQDILQGFHNALVMQSGAYQNGTWVVGVAKGGVEEGVDSLAQSCIIAPSGQIVAQALTTGDELVTARCDLDWCRRYTGTLFDFDRYRRPELYGRITAQRGVEIVTAIETTHSRFHRQRHARGGAVGPSAPAGRPAGGAGHHLAQGRLLTVGSVRLLHGAGRRARRRRLPDLAGQGGGALGRHRSKGSTEDERQRFADAFAACGGLQCGFCIPGIVVRAKAQIDKKGADLTRGDMARHLGAHLCRCTGYVKVLDAIEAVAAGKELEASLPGGVGTSGARYEAGELTLGDRGYVDDIRVPGMLHAALHLTDHTRADIHRIDIESARKAPGVVAVYTAADIPGELRVGIIHTDWPIMIPEGGRTSYAGDVLAIVVAETRQQARAAAELVTVDYGVLRPFTDPKAALEDPEPAVWGTDSNTLSVSEYRRGDADAALSASAHVVEETFRTQRIEHAFLEPEATLAVPDPARRTMHVYSGGQGVWDDRNQIASVLGVDPSGSPSSWCRTAAPSAARRTWPTRPTPRSPRGCCSAR